MEPASAGCDGGPETTGEEVGQEYLSLLGDTEPCFLPPLKSPQVLASKRTRVGQPWSLLGTEREAELALFPSRAPCEHGHCVRSCVGCTGGLNPSTPTPSGTMPPSRGVSGTC